MHHISDFHLVSAARQAMIEHGFQPDYPKAAIDELHSELAAPIPPTTLPGTQDLRHLLWSSIDNDTSRDLDQIEHAETLPDGRIRVRVAIADVSQLVPLGSALDDHAQRNTTSIYTGVVTFMMLPEELSAGVTSLLPNQDRNAIVIEFTVSSDDCLCESNVYPALVRNRAQLTYNAVGAWLEGSSPAAESFADPELQSQLRLQHQIAERLREERARHGALTLDMEESEPIIVDGQLIDLRPEKKNPAHALIEDFMIAANGVVARFLTANNFASIRRIVRTPKRWERIVSVAATLGADLPGTPDAKALNEFLTQQRAKDPVHFPDLSLTIVKLMGPGEYVAEQPNDPPTGHFGLAVEDYTHSTAPNRRYPDLVTQRLIKAAIQKQPSPYTEGALTAIATHCTQMGDEERRLEREMHKKIAAVVMSKRIGQTFNAVVTGINHYGTFVRTLAPHVDGMLVEGQKGLDVGDRLHVKLLRTDPWKGYIDFAKA
ncbi:MAG: RNB domain-containing ribonuclease [Acidobacteriaceae bacterium]